MATEEKNIPEDTASKKPVEAKTEKVEATEAKDTAPKKEAKPSDAEKKPVEAKAEDKPSAAKKDDKTATSSEKKPAGKNDRARNSRSGGGGRKGGGKGRGGDKPKKEFQEVLLEVRRVTRVTTGGRQLAFRAIIVIGNGKGKIGLGVAKGNDVSIAVRKATHEAYKNVVEAPVTDELTVPYTITHKYKSAIVKLIPAAQGTGMKAGSSVRTVLELAGYNNMLSKIIGTNNKLNNAIAAIQALSKYKKGKTPPTQSDDKGKGKTDKKAKTDKVVAKDSEAKKETKEAPVA